MTKITRIDSNERLSRVVIHGDTIYIAGTTASVKGDIVMQTRLHNDVSFDTGGSACNIDSVSMNDDTAESFV